MLDKKLGGALNDQFMKMDDEFLTDSFMFPKCHWPMENGRYAFWQKWKKNQLDSLMVWAPFERVPTDPHKAFWIRTQTISINEGEKSMFHWRFLLQYSSALITDMIIDTDKRFWIGRIKFKSFRSIQVFLASE